ILERRRIHFPAALPHIVTQQISDAIVRATGNAAPLQRGVMKLGTFSRPLLALVLISALSLVGGVASGDDQGSSDVVAEVGGHKITRSQLDQHQSDNMTRARS